jgi:hypothetical protein
VSDAIADDGYRGPAELVDGEAVVAVEARLAGHFDPISGHYKWWGRVRADAAAGPAVAELAAARREVLLRTPHASVPTTLSDLDPWGRPRVEGFGAAPFPVADTLPADTD